MKDIYQLIWDADQQQSGITPILSSQEGNHTTGFVRVNENMTSTNQDTKVLKEVVIPDTKRRTYELCKRLFDNYALSEKDEELDTPEEREEVHDFVSAILDSAPMQLAKDYIVEQTGTSLTRERWHNTIMEMWFRRFAQSGEPHLTGFEHVVVGEQDGRKAQGYHFWYKYYLDDGFANEVDGIHDEMFPAIHDDRIVYLGTKMKDAQYQHPESVTLSYKWYAADYDKGELRPLTKPVGGFFVGCSVEGLMALGTVRAHRGINAPKKAVINGAEYQMALYHSSNGRHIRTFYPKFIRSVGSVNTQPSTPISTPTPTPTPTDNAAVVDTSKVRIIAALVNPLQHDPGLETVTLINTGTVDVNINNWSIADKNAKTSSIQGETLKAGATYQFRLDGQGAQLSNKGGVIKLLNASGNLVHSVSYSKGAARNHEGETLIF